MTILLPEHYHAQDALETQNITCITQESARKQDIRPLRIGILNIMPNVKTYEFNLLYPLGKSIIQIVPVWIKLNTHQYKNSSQQHLDNLYVTFEEAIAKKHLDGLILTGAPVEEYDFDEVKYWPEVARILKFARRNIASTLGICWGGMALAFMLGINKVNLGAKIFGIYRTKNLNCNHPITGDLDDHFNCPQSRHAGYSDQELEQAEKDGLINLLAYNKDSGYTIFESSDKRYLMHLGHPEYNSGRLIEETLRDRKLGRDNVGEPKNFSLDNPENCWRSHRNEFFSQWIKHVYLETEY